MFHYKVIIDGTEVWSADVDSYQGLTPFPAGYTGRPEAGTVELWIDEELVATQVPLTVEQQQAAAAEAQAKRDLRTLAEGQLIWAQETLAQLAAEGI